MVLKMKYQVLLGCCALILGTVSGYSPFHKYKRFPQQITPSQNYDPQDKVSFNKFSTVYQWRIMDFEYPSAEAKQQAFATG